MLKKHSKYGMKEILRKAKFIIPSPVPPDLVLDISAGRISRELWWTNQEFSAVDISPPRFSILVYHQLVHAVQRRSFTLST
jgi:hypothetical protein